MKISSYGRPARNYGPGLSREVRRNWSQLARFLRAVAALLLTLSCLVSPCAASGQEAEGGDSSQHLVPHLVRPDATSDQKVPPPPTGEGLSESEDRVKHEKEPAPPKTGDSFEQDDRAEIERKVEGAPAPRRAWYGWQILLADGGGQTLAFALGVTLANYREAGMIAGATGLATYALGGPSVHFAHGNVGKGFGSLGLRVGLPVVGVAAGVALGCGLSEDQYFCGFWGFPGFIVGAFSAIAIDAGALAYDEVPREETARRSRGLMSLAVLPLASPDGGGLSVKGAF